MKNTPMIEGYAEALFSAASAYDVQAQKLLDAVEHLLARIEPFPLPASEKPDTSLAERSSLTVGQDILAFSIPVTPGKLTLAFFFDRAGAPKEANSHLVSFRALDSIGRELDILGLSRSRHTEIGHYCYLHADEKLEQRIDLKVPFGAERLRLEFRRFRKDAQAPVALRPYYKLFPADLEGLAKELNEARGRLIKAARAPRGAPAPRQARDLRWLYIMDAFTERCLSSVTTGYKLSRDKYAEQILSSTCRFLFLESAWQGNEGNWTGAMTYKNPQHPHRMALQAAIALAKQRGMKVIFYNKEDPLHFDLFLPIAQEADMIFTSDADMEAAYRKSAPGAQVRTLAFAAPADFCNPAGSAPYSERGTAAFAGAYYGEGHDVRASQMRYMLEPIRAFDGAIFDRHSARPEDKYRFPDKYRPFCRNAIPYEEIVKQYGQFKVFLNVNTIVDSPTMISRRVYELLARGTPVVSAPSKALEMQFGDVVSVANTAEEAVQEVGRLVSDEEYWRRRSHLGYRFTMTSHTYADRAREIRAALNGSVETDSDASPPPLVSIIIPTREPGEHLTIVENVARQTHDPIEIVIGFGPNYKDEDVRKTLASLEAATRGRPSSPPIRHERFGVDAPLGHKLNILVQIARGEIVAKMDDDDYYGPNYISDMILPMKWGGYDIVGKSATFWFDGASDRTYLKNENDAHRKTNFIYGATLVCRRELLHRHPFEPRGRGEDTFALAKLLSSGARIYASDPYNFCVIRRRSGHTWTLPSKYFETKARTIGVGFRNESIDL